MPSVSKLVRYLFCMWRKYCITVTFMTLSCDSVCCMCGKAWSSRSLMTQLTNGQHAWVLELPMVDTLNAPYDCQFVSLYLVNFMFHTTLNALGNILRVHYESMKCGVSFSQGSISTLLKWDEHAFRVCVKCSSCLQQCKNYFFKSIEFFQSYYHKFDVLPRFCDSQCIYYGHPIGPAIIFCRCGFLVCLLFSSPILSGHRLDDYHTSTHDLALVGI